MAPAVVVGPAVWGLSPDTPGTGLGALTYAMKHVATVGRPVGGSGAVPDAVRGALEAAGGTVRTRRAGRLHPLRGRAGAGRRAGRRHRGRGADRGVGLRPSRHVPQLAPPPAGVGHAADRPLAVGAQPRRLREQGRRGHRHPADLRAARSDPARPPRLRAPPRHRHRRPTARRDGGGPPADGGRTGGGATDVLRQRPVGPRPAACRSTGATCSASRRSTRPTRLQGGWTASAEPQRWLEVYGERVAPGLPRRRRTLAGDDARTSTSGTSSCRGATPRASPAARSPRCGARTAS